VEEIWCALSGRAADGTHVRDRLRDILFAALEDRFPGAVFEIRGDWPAVRLAGGKWSRWACTDRGHGGSRARAGGPLGRVLRGDGRGSHRCPVRAAAGRLSGLPDVSAANEFPGSQVGSQRRQAPGNARPHRARITAGERLACRHPAPSSGSRGLYGMQKVRGSNPLSSTMWSSRFCGDHFHV
jgi:hypothetical protein